MSQQMTLDEMTTAGAHRKGHFRLSSGLHSGDYLQCALYLAHPTRAARAGGLLAEALDGLGLNISLIVSPALGGLIIGHETARALGVPFIFTERQEGAMVLRRGFAVEPGQVVAVVEDVVTTGKSTREVIEVLTSAGATVAAVGAMVNRSTSENPFAPTPFAPLLAVTFPTWEQSDCPLCATGDPIVKPGSRPVA